MATTVFSRGAWMPRGVEEDGALLLEVLGGADALHDPRGGFRVPLHEEHLTARRDSLRRHVLLQAVPLCYEAGNREDWDERAATCVLDPILLGSQEEVDSTMPGLCVDRRSLVAHRASLPLLARCRYFDAAQSVTEPTDWARVRRRFLDAFTPAHTRVIQHAGIDVGLVATRPEAEDDG